MAVRRSTPREPYRSKKRTPRQTRFYRKRKLQESTQQSSDPNQGSNSLGNQLDDEVINQPAQQPSTLSDHHNLSVECHPHPKLYSNSHLTTNTSNLTVSSYISRHHLSRQAQEDLIILLHLHVSPATSLFPRSLYTFKKNSVVYDPQNVQQTDHYFCKNCYSSLMDDKCTICLIRYAT